MTTAEELNLRNTVLALPEAEPGEHVWQTISRRIHPAKPLHVKWIPLAMAATFVFGLSVMIHIDMTEPSPDSGLVASASERVETAAETVEIADIDPVLASLLEETEQLEQSIRSTPQLIYDESPTQRLLVSRLYDIDNEILTSNKHDVERQKELLERRNAMLKSYQTLRTQRQPTTPPLARVSF